MKVVSYVAGNPLKVMPLKSVLVLMMPIFCTTRSV